MLSQMYSQNFRLPQEMSAAQPVSKIQLDHSSSTSATTCCVPEIHNLSLVNFESRGNCGSDSDTGDSDSDSDTDSIYCTELSEALEQWCTTDVEQCNFNSTSVPLVDLPISREGLLPEDFIIPTREELAAEQKADTELRQLRDWLESKQPPSADELAGFSGRMKSLAQLFDQISIREDVLVIRRHDDPERELTLVPNTRVEHIIRYYHEGPGGAHQAPKATSAKIIGCFWWPDLKRDVWLYVTCCPTCEKFIRLNRTPKAGLRLMEVGGRGDCLAMDIVGGMDSLPLTPRGNCYILTLIDCFTSFSTACRSIGRGTDCISLWSLHYRVRYSSPYTNRSRTKLRIRPVC